MNTLSADNVLTKEKIDRLREFEAKPVESDDEYPERTDDLISDILKKAKAQKKAKGSSHVNPRMASYLYPKLPTWIVEWIKDRIIFC